MSRLQDISILPGRIRLKNYKLYYNKSLSRYINCHIDNLYGVKNSRVNHNIATILIIFDPKKTNAEIIKHNIDELINVRYSSKSKEFEEFDEYQKVLQKRDDAKKNLIFFGLIYITLKIKQALYGNFPFSSSVPVLKAASVITIIGGYPLIKKFYLKISKNLPFNSEVLYNMTAVSFTLMRESSKGVFVLVLKHLNEFKKYSAEANSQSLLWQSMEGGFEKPWEKQDISREELKIHQRVNDYQNKITHISLGIGLVGFILSGSPLYIISTLLALTPKAAGTALHIGMKNYLVLLNKYNIYLRNVNVIEKIANTKHIVFDRTETLTYGEKSGVSRRDPLEMINKLKQRGFSSITMVTGDTQEKAQEVAKKLGITSFYSNCQNEDKEKIILELKKSGIVLMVGDGVNDINAMRSADVSVSFINSTCDRIKLHSDCIILHDDMIKLLDVLGFSRKTYTYINQNISFAQGFNIFWGGVALFGQLNPFTAKSLNTLNSLIVLLLNKRIEYVSPDRFIGGSLEQLPPSFPLTR